jgi:hypothetical protein
MQLQMAARELASLKGIFDDFCHGLMETFPVDNSISLRTLLF